MRTHPFFPRVPFWKSRLVVCSSMLHPAVAQRPIHACQAVHPIAGWPPHWLTKSGRVNAIVRVAWATLGIIGSPLV